MQAPTIHLGTVEFPDSRIGGVAWHVYEAETLRAPRPPVGDDRGLMYRTESAEQLGDVVLGCLPRQVGNVDAVANIVGGVVRLAARTLRLLVGWRLAAQSFTTRPLGCGLTHFVPAAV